MFFCIFFSENHDFASRFILMIGQNFRQHHTVRMVLPQLVDKVLCSDLESHKRGKEINNGPLPPNPYLPEIERKMWSFALCGVRLRAPPQGLCP